MCIIDQNDKLRCAGSNTSGQLGVGASIPSRDTLQPVDDTQSYKAISLGDYHTCALRSSGELVCWGDNFVGQIGLPIVDRPLVQGN
jgi:alpha-tubulin suppressor-like RCC1 family protein